MKEIALIILIKLAVPMSFLVWVLLTPEVSDWWSVLSVLLMSGSVTEKEN